jgi:hypothetical protein
MNDGTANLISASLPITGLSAYSYHEADQLIEVQVLTKSVYPSSAQEMLSRVVQSGLALLPAGDRPVQYCWTFESHRVYVAGRSDGASLALLVENIATTQMVQIQKMLQGFQELSEAPPVL